MKNKWFVFSLMLIVAIATACQSKTTGPQISAEDAWGRPSPMVATAGAFYMTITNTGNESDTLLSVGTDVCGTVELHESYMKDDGAMGMRMVEGGVIEIPAGKTVELKVGGLHVMCINKLAEFKVGDTYTLSLAFEKSGNITVQAEIREP